MFAIDAKLQVKCLMRTPTSSLEAYAGLNLDAVNSRTSDVDVEALSGPSEFQAIFGTVSYDDSTQQRVSARATVRVGRGD